MLIFYCTILNGSLLLVCENRLPNKPFGTPFGWRFVAGDIIVKGCLDGMI